MTQLSAAGFVLRPFVESDAAAFAAAVRESTATVGVWMPWASADYSESQALAWFAMCAAVRANGSGYEFGIFREDGVSLVGGAALNHMNSVHALCNLGYWVRASAQRQGAALAAIRALTPYAFGQLQLSRVEIVVAAGNDASMAVAEKSGATHECLARNRLQLHGRAVDGHVFSIIPNS
jgi:ribosomal-protein-serine acetyltransferase